MGLATTSASTSPIAADPDAVEASAETSGSGRHGRSDTLIGRAALVVIVAHLAFYGWNLSRGYFFADDYFAAAFAFGQRLNSSFLLLDGGGHMSPGGWLVWYGLSRVAPLDYRVAASSLVAAQAVVAIGCWLLVREVAGRTWASVVLLALCLFSPLSVPSELWVANAVTALAMGGAFAYGAWSHLVGVRTGHRRWFVASGAATLLGLLFWERVALLPVVLFLVSFAAPSLGSFRHRVVAVARLWPAWLAQTVAVGAYLALRLQNTYSAPPDTGATLSGIVGYGTKAFAMALFGIVGGPLRWRPVVEGQPLSVAAPATWWMVAGVLGFVVAIGVSVWRRRDLLLVWGVLGVYLIGSVALTGYGRLGGLGDNLWREMRYVSELPIVAALVAASVVAAGVVQPRRLVLLVASGVFVAEVWSSAAYANQWRVAPTRPYVENLRRTSTEAGDDRAVLDALLPDAFLMRAFAPHDTVGALSKQLDAAVAVEPRTRYRAVDSQGNLVAGELQVVNRGLGPSCGSGRAELAVPTGIESPFWVVRVTYESSAATEGILTVGSRTSVQRLALGRGELLSYSREPVSSVALSADEVRLCIESVDVGVAKATRGSEEAG